DRAAPRAGRAAPRGVAHPLRRRDPPLAALPRQARGGGGQDRAAHEGRARRPRPRPRGPAQEDAVRPVKQSAISHRSARLDVEGELEERRRLVEEALDRALPPESAWPETLHRAVRYS